MHWPQALHGLCPENTEVRTVWKCTGRAVNLRRAQFQDNTIVSLNKVEKNHPSHPRKLRMQKKKRSTLVQLELTHLSESLQLNVGVLISVCRGVRVLMSVPHWPTQQYHTWSFDGEHRPAKASRVCMCGLP